MIYLVDNTLDGTGASPNEIRAALTKIDPSLEIVTDRFESVSIKRIEELSPSHIILSGQSHPWKLYSRKSLAGVFDVIRTAPKPILGVCGGHQQIALAFEAPVDVMKRLAPGKGYEGCLRERGFSKVRNEGGRLFHGITESPTFWHSHYDEVKLLPESFRRTASNDTCAIQAMEHTSLPIFGVQFHPELFDDQYTEGRILLDQFLGL